MVAATWDSVTVWSTSSGDRTHQRETKERFNSCIFHPARRWVLIAGGDKVIDRSFLHVCMFVRGIDDSVMLADSGYLGLDD